MYRIISGSTDMVVRGTASIVEKVARKMAIQNGVCYVHLLMGEDIVNIMAFRVRK